MHRDELRVVVAVAPWVLFILGSSLCSRARVVTPHITIYAVGESWEGKASTEEPQLVLLDKMASHHHFLW